MLFPIPVIAYKLGLLLCTKIFNFNQFVNTLDLGAFSPNPEILPCNCDESSDDDKHREYIVTDDLRVIKNNVLTRLFIKGPKFRESKPINFDKVKSYILTDLEKCIQKRCNKNGRNKNFFF